MRQRTMGIGMGLVLLFQWPSAAAAQADSAPASGAPAVGFRLEVYPLFQQRCLRCHGPDRAEGSLRLDRREFAARGGHTGSPILGGTVDNNSILKRVSTTDESIRMPKGEPPLAAAEIDLLRRWVEQGTTWDDPPNDSPPPPARYELTWQSLQPWDPREWSNARFDRLRWWGWRFGPPILALLAWIGLCDRARYWVQTGHARVQPPRGGGWRRLGSVSRAAHAALLAGLALVAAVVFIQQHGREADLEIAGLNGQVAALQQQLDPGRDHRSPVPRPVRPKHPPRLGGEYYRGNDERNPALFNGGFYRTCDMRVWLCRADDSLLAWGDAVDPASCQLRFEIEQSPGAADGLFTQDVMAGSYISAAPPDEAVRDAALQIAVFQPDGPKRWVARLPLDLSQAAGVFRRGVVYVCRGAAPSTGEKMADPHYAAEYAIQLSDGRISRDSELWMGYVFRTDNVVPVPQGKIGEDEWFSFRPIPEIEGSQTTDDPKLLGIEAHRGEIGVPAAPPAGHGSPPQP